MKKLIATLVLFSAVLLIPTASGSSEVHSCTVYNFLFLEDTSPRFSRN